MAVLYLLSNDVGIVACFDLAQVGPSMLDA